MKNLLFIPILFLCLTASSQEMQKYLVDTKAMVKAGNYKEALERHVWFHDHALEKEPAMAGVRLSFALSDWKELGAVYPAALDEMKTIRDRKTKLILSDGGNTQLFMDVKGLNRSMGESFKTVELFDKLLATYPDKAKANWFFVKDDLFDA